MRARLGVNTCFAAKRWPRPDDWAPIVAHELGLDTVELSLDLLGGTTGAAQRQRTAEDTRAALSRHGLRAVTTFTGLAAYSQSLLMHPEPGRRRAALRWYRGVVDLTARLGASGTGGHVGAMSAADWSAPASRARRWAGLRAALTEIAAYARDAGLHCLLIENMAAVREPSTMSDVETLLTDGDAAHVPARLCLDVGHPWGAGIAGAERDPYAWLRRFGSRLAEVQLHQSDGLADRHWPFTPEHNAAGRIDPGRVLATLAASGARDVLLVLEVIPAFEEDDKQVIDGLRASAELWKDAMNQRGLA